MVPNKYIKKTELRRVILFYLIGEVHQFYCSLSFPLRTLIIDVPIYLYWFIKSNSVKTFKAIIVINLKVNFAYHNWRKKGIHSFIVLNPKPKIQGCVDYWLFTKKKNFIPKPKLVKVADSDYNVKKKLTNESPL